MIPAPLLIALLGAGAYYLGRRAGQKRTDPPPYPVPTPIPGRLGAAEDLASTWDNLQHDVLVFPPGSDLDFAPPEYEGISFSSGCEAVAVGEGFWDRMREARAARPRARLWQVMARVIPKAAMKCLADGEPAMSLLREEIAERLAITVSVFNAPRREGVWYPNPKRAQAQWEVVYESEPPRVADALRWAIGGRR